ncbi:MAG: RsmB/NOP family class I SAM-dependent RNA methyltransferase [Erysipelotrichaceae bacterium]|nr:RsmB/NOP family class I SAM-dependent RNA methyltransferase [Erysipelotrichaceae bacterium]
MPELPESYLKRMKEILADGYDDYLKSFSDERVYGLRINTSKISVENFLKISPFKLERIPWTNDGFYYHEEDRPAKHPYYFAGLYYLQEPSAMLPAEVLPVRKSDLILDACAAPGGKSSKLANKLQETGAIIANDISASRAQILLRTMETQGVKNSYVMAEDITTIRKFSHKFDAILIDAPCSGEGMFRKESDLIRSWLEKGSDYYAPIQKKIITSAIEMLKDGGMMVYSTCTFSPQENEEVIEYALYKYPDLKVIPFEFTQGFEHGLTEKTYNCVRLYPHLIKGEGHFVALLQKGENKTDNTVIDKIAISEEPFIQSLKMEFKNGFFIRRKDKLYFEPDIPVDLGGLRILRSGFFLGEYRYERFEPAHNLACVLKENEFPVTLNFDLNDERVLRYLKCETLNVKDKNVEGYVLVCVDHHPLGFGKVSKGILKNRYPFAYSYK